MPVEGKDGQKTGMYLVLSKFVFTKSPCSTHCRHQQCETRHQLDSQGKWHTRASRWCCAKYVNTKSLVLFATVDTSKEKLSLTLNLARDLVRSWTAITGFRVQNADNYTPRWTRSSRPTLLANGRSRSLPSLANEMSRVLHAKHTRDGKLSVDLIAKKFLASTAHSLVLSKFVYAKTPV